MNSETTVYKMIATCPDELKHTVSSELEKLGAQSIKQDYRVVYFEIEGYENFLKLHVELRTPSRLFCILASLGAQNFEQLRRGVSKLPWVEWLDSRKTFVVEGVPGDRGPGFMKANDISRAVREGLQEYYRKAKEDAPQVDLEEADIELIAFVRGGRCLLSYNSSGKAMHKRGYRVKDHPAPIKETLAASLLTLVGYDGTQNFYDPMCGSGTIPIEACMISLQKAPLIHRKKGDFGFEHFNNFDNQIWMKVCNELRERKESEPKAKIFASDIDRKFVEDAKANALKARVEKHIHIFSGDFFKVEAPAESGILLANLPYGERLESEEAFEEFYKKIGDKLKQSYKSWNVWFLVAAESPFNRIGLKPFKKYSLKNGSVNVKLLGFQIYEGSKKLKHQTKD